MSRFHSPQARHALRVGISFWLFGLINNVLYVIILSAALDLVGPSIPKGVVLLADVFPSFVTKLIAPYFIHLIEYKVRVIALVIISIIGMLVISLTPATHSPRVISLKLFGVALASLSSGGGELSFLALTHFYGHVSLASWSSGTGGAGLVGAGAYVLATTTFGWLPRTTLLAFAFLPFVMLITFFAFLPPPVSLKTILNQGDSARARKSSSDGTASPLLHDEQAEDADRHEAVPEPGFERAHSRLKVESAPLISSFTANLRRAQGLFIPFMIPLLLVYVAEYVINQGIAPTLLFALDETPFRNFRDFYPTYNAIYQVGVLISRSSTPFVRVRNLYLPSLLQNVNLAILTLHALFDFIPSIYLVFIIIFWEGLLGGLVYVNTFAEISDRVPLEDREFSLAATTVSDSGGITLAAFISIALEKGICSWQVDHGRDFCKRT